jgi:hypothetical protein
MIQASQISCWRILFWSGTHILVRVLISQVISPLTYPATPGLFSYHTILLFIGLPCGADKHGRAVHHGTAQSAHLTDTQTSPFANRLTAVCRCTLFLPKLPRCSALLHRLCRLSTEDWPTYQPPPLYHCYYLNTLILPNSLPIRLRSTTD